MTVPLFREDIWRIGHVLSRMGLIEAACQMRDVANDVDGEGGSELRAKEILDRLYFQDCFIDKALWHDLSEWQDDRRPPTDLEINQRRL